MRSWPRSIAATAANCQLRPGELASSRLPDQTAEDAATQDGTRRDRFFVEIFRMFLVEHVVDRKLDLNLPRWLPAQAYVRAVIGVDGVTRNCRYPAPGEIELDVARQVDARACRKGMFCVAALGAADDIGRRAAHVEPG